MKVMLENNVSAIAATNVDSNFPASEILTESPSDIMKATGTTSTVTATVGDLANGCALFNVPASTITLTVKNTAETETIEALGTFDMSGIRTMEEFFYLGAAAPLVNLYVPYSLPNQAHKVIADITAETGEKAQCGCFWCGWFWEFRNPKYGLVKGSRDYSIKKKRSGGGIYTKKLPTVSTFSGSIGMKRDTDAYSFIRKYQAEVGPKPRPWLVADMNNYQWLIFASLDSEPRETHSFPDYNDMNISLIEEV